MINVEYVNKVVDCSCLRLLSENSLIQFRPQDPVLELQIDNRHSSSISA